MWLAQNVFLNPIQVPHLVPYNVIKNLNTKSEREFNFNNLQIWLKFIII